MKKVILKFLRSFIKLILPLIFKFLIKIKSNRRVINYLSESSYKSNSKYEFEGFIKKLLDKEKILALDVGAQGCFNSDEFFPKKYNFFFEDILVEPIEEEAKKYANILGYNYNSCDWFKQSYKILNKDYKIKKIERDKTFDEENNFFKKIIKMIK